MDRGGGNARPSIVQDAEGRVISEGVAFNTTGRPHKLALTDGEAHRRHGGHAWCWLERPALCVTRYIHEQCTSRLGGDPETRADRAFAIYEETKAAIGQEPAGDDAIDFWRNVFQARVGNVTAKAADTRESRTLAAARFAGNSPRRLP